MRSSAASATSTATEPGPAAGVVAALLSVQILFGVHYYAAKIVLAEIPPLPWAALRVALAGAVLLPLAARRAPLPRPGMLLRLAGLSIFGVIINQLCFVEGLSRTSVSHSALINATIPVLTLLLAVALGSERARTGKWTAIFLALTGVLVLLRVDRMEWDRMAHGDLLTLLNAASFAAFLVLARPVMLQMDPFLATAWMFVFGGGALLLLATPRLARLEPAGWSGATWGWGIYAILGATVVAYSLNSISLRRAESSFVAFFVFLQPLIGAGLDRWLLGNPLQPRLGVAALFILAGLAVALRAGQREAARRRSRTSSGESVARKCPARGPRSLPMRAR